MSIEDFPFSKECETDADCVDDSRGHFCKGHWFCMPPFIITKRESVRDIAAQNFCRANSDCPSDETCSNFSCVAKSVDKAPKVDDSASAFRFIRRSPQSLICHNSVDCDGGYCYHGICVAEPPRLDSELESRSPQGLICHNSADCDGGVCYHGICVAEPPMAQTPKQPRQASQV
ncbi:hypothetical protein BJY01DRAFT_209574 [Aspergillus pseudoustus]|uniref:Dickkopf N-terminal cysteine-rich domain-containing protein n=1 Tax=Aspergillus pseudoustus TaxID=1810923 RepID=A0ABR4KEL1_9EURO